MCRLILLDGFCRSVLCQRFRQRGRRVRPADRDMVRRHPPAIADICQFAVTGMVLRLGGQSKMIAKSFLKAFKIAVIIRTTCSVAINYSAVGARS